MRWSWIATGFLLTALLRFGFGRPESKHQTWLEPVRAEAGAKEVPRPETPPLPTPAPDGPSILSLLEIGPAEITQEVAKSPQPAPPDKPGTTGSLASAAVEDAAAKRMLTRRAFRGALMVVHTALDVCSKQQLARNPRLRGKISLTLTVGSQPGIDRGILTEVGIDTPQMYVPLFDGCVRIALGSASFPKPAPQIHFTYPYALEPSEDPTSVDDEQDDSAEQSETDSAETETAAATTPASE